MVADRDTILAHAPARWWRLREDGRIECELCPRACKLRPGQQGFCVVRRRVSDHLELATYGRTSGFCIDPIEKKPLYHFLPGSGALSFGTAGCNLDCRFCQNWELTKTAVLAGLSARATPEEVAAAAELHGCDAVAFTYNDPVIFAEYAIDVARACHERRVKTVAVTAGFINPVARAEFFSAMDAANIDLKAFDDEFYRRVCHARLAPVLETLEYVRHDTAVWLEVTTLLIPGANDDEEKLQRAAEWFVRRLGADVPWHFTAYHPDYLLSAPPTPHETLERARAIAQRAGVQYVYIGNLADTEAANTRCAHCGAFLIGRNGYRIFEYNLDGDHCRFCHGVIPGRFATGPGGWGGRIYPIRI